MNIKIDDEQLTEAISESLVSSIRENEYLWEGITNSFRDAIDEEIRNLIREVFSRNKDQLISIILKNLSQ
jgi:hypothetical protein